MVKPEKEMSFTANVWILHIPNEITQDRRESLHSILSDAEQKRLSKMGSDKRRMEYLLNHAMVRIKCAEILSEADPRKVPLVFVEGEAPRLGISDLRQEAGGKKQEARSRKQDSGSLVEGSQGHCRPSTIDHRQHFISLSHTKDLVACALSPHPIGIDVEKIREPKQQDAVAKKYFSEEEVYGLNQFEGEKKWRRFYEIWTLKESFFKASDLSVGDVVKKTSFEINSPSPPLSLRGGEGELPTTWQFRLLSPTPLHVMAVAVKSDGEVRVDLKEVGLAELF